MDIRQLEELWIHTLAASPPSLEQFENLAEELVKNWKSGDREIVQAIRKRLARLRNLSDSEIRNAEFVLADAQL